MPTVLRSTVYALILLCTPHCAILAFLLVTGQQAHGQSSVGIQPFGSYSGQFDQINVSSLAVHIDIPLFVHKGIGDKMGLSVRLVYDTGGGVTVLGPWSFVDESASAGSVASTSFTSPCTGENSNGESYTTSSYSFVDDTGFTHFFAGTSVSPGCTNNSVVATSLNENATDGSGYQLVAGGGLASVSDPSGVIVVPYNGEPSKVIAPSGNGGQSSFVCSSQHEGCPASYTLTDDSQITVTINENVGGTATGLEYTDTQGNKQSITIGYQSYSLDYLAGSPQQYNTTSVNLVSSIAYPDGTSYSFTYQPSPQNADHTSGYLKSITLPTGGTISYQTVASLTNSCGATSLSRTTQDGTTTYTRTDNSTSGAAPPFNATATTTSVTHPDQSMETINSVISDVYYPSSIQNGGYSTYYLETSHSWLSASGATLKSTMRCYNGAASPCTTTPVTYPISHISTSTTLDSLSPWKTVEFLNAQSLPTEVDEYDFGATSPTRKTITAYASLSNNILDRPSSVTVENGSSTSFSKTTYGYDEYSLPGLCLVSTQGAACATSIATSRGNRTSQHVWLNTTGGTLDSHWQYDDRGQVRATEDPRLYWTSFGYDTATDSCQISTTPPTPSSGVSQATSAVCDPNTGLVSSTTDANGVKTTYSYNSMLQAAGASAASGSTVAASYSILYSGETLPETITKTVTATPSPSQVTTTTLDGLGRTSLQQLPSGATIATTYDVMGRIHTMTNPYLSTSDSSYGVTTYAYDALGRKTLQTQPDNSTQSWTYDGNTVIAKDENGNQWKRIDDAFGRLTEVLEPNGTSATPSMTTVYTYDVLSNLLSATQGIPSNNGGCTIVNDVVNCVGPTIGDAVVRNFNYDSASRLLCASNPENSSASCLAAASSSYTPGTTGYTYDANGNLLTKVSPGLNGASGTQTIGYCYDALNRLVGKWSATPPSGCNSTPTSVASNLLAAYTFDTSAIGGTKTP